MKRLTPSEARALLGIVKHVFITCANLGSVLWGRNVAGNCSCPWARPAGKVVKRLRTYGLVERHRVTGDPRTFYRATTAGERQLITDADTRAAAGLDPTTAAPRRAKRSATKRSAGKGG